MSDDITKLMKDMVGTPIYDQLLSYLLARRATPVIKEGYLGDSTSGEFSRNTMFGNELPRHGQIKLDYGLFSGKDNKAAGGTLSHELTHAADSQVEDQYYELKRKSNKTPEEERFVQAYDKLFHGVVPNEQGKLVHGNHGSQTVEMAKRLNPEWTKKNKEYRSTGKELAAFGVGNSVSGTTDSYNTPQHLDATLATERSILLDAAMRAQAQQPIKGR